MADTREIEERFMQRALDLARATEGQASPNPMVGCVLVRGGAIVGEGAHLYEKRDHAEIAALKQARERGVDLSAATAYVTLEPCSHQGRTGPCADALVTANVRRVVVATVDPNPQVSGRGIERLRLAGIEVVVGVMQQEARAINDAFAWSIRSARPLVTLKAALSEDGMIAPSASSRAEKQTFWLTGAEERAEVQRMRHGSDAVLTGIGTVLADDPMLTDRSGQARRRRLLRVILDSRLRLPLDSKLVRSAQRDLLVFCGAGADEDRATALQAAGVEVVRVAEMKGHLDLEAVLSALGARQILGVLLECGSALNGAFLKQRLVDKAVLFYAPTKLGEGAVPFAAGFGSPSELEQALLSVRRKAFGVDACVAGELRDPWASIGS